MTFSAATDRRHPAVLGVIYGLARWLSARAAVRWR
jgi:hypothetical protein